MVSQLGGNIIPRGQMTTSGDILLITVHGMLLTSSGKRPGMVLNTP